MRIEKTIKGEKFRFKMFFTVNTMEAEVYIRGMKIIGKISEDFLYINMPPGTLSPYIGGYGEVPIKRFKLNKALQYDAKEYQNVKA